MVLFLEAEIATNLNKLLGKELCRESLKGADKMLKFKYALTNAGIKRCLKDEFYLQETHTYRGYTKKIFHILYKSERPLTIREISKLTGIQNRSVNGVITFNIYAGYITRIPL